jgi:hypothetical protein
MSRGFYRWLLTALLLVAVSGVSWCVLHYFFAAQTSFGSAPNPAEPALLRIHGIAAIAAVFLLGGIATGHVAAAWDRARNRPSGLALSATAITLILSGYALYYITVDSLRAGVGIAHEAIGIAAIVVALVHWKRTPR